MYDKSISVEDRLEIQELYARYAQAADQCDGQAWSNCFIIDGFFAPSIGPGAKAEYRGREALAAFITAPARVPNQDRHWNTAFTFERDGEDVRGVCYAFLLRVKGVEKPEIVGSVVYHDLLTKEDGAWKFKERRPTSDAE